MGPSGGFPEDSAGARGEGLEPSITGPEPVVLPITPPPNGWTISVAEVVGVVIAPCSGVVEPVEVIEPDDPAQTHSHRLLQEIGHGRPACDRGCLGGGGRGGETQRRGDG